MQLRRSATSDSSSDHHDLDGEPEPDNLELGDPEPEDLESEELEPDEEDLAEAEVEDLVLDDEEDEEHAVLDVGLDGAEGAVGQVTAPAADAEGDEEEELADDVEASLDVILAERLSGEAEGEDDGEDLEEDIGTPAELATIIPVRRPEEFLCQSCFLLKPPSQLADADHQLCRDCA